MNNYELELLVKDKLDRVKAHADHQRLVHEVRGQQLPKKAFLVQVLAFILIPLRLVGKSYVGDQRNRDRNAHQRTTVQPLRLSLFDRDNWQMNIRQKAPTIIERKEGNAGSDRL